MHIRFLLPLLLLPLLLPAQEKPARPLQLSLFSNATLLPGSGVAGVLNFPVHPGFTAGTAFTYHQAGRHELFQTVKAGYFYHRQAQHAVMLFSEGGYRTTAENGFYVQTLLGGGYLHSIPDVQSFELNSEGEYVSKGRFGRPQGMAGLTLGFGYQLNQTKNKPFRIGLNYQFWFQFPFVAGYVPVLPNTALHLTFEMNLLQRKAK